MANTRRSATRSIGPQSPPKRRQAVSSRSSSSPTSDRQVKARSVGDATANAKLGNATGNLSPVAEVSHLATTEQSIAAGEPSADVESVSSIGSDSSDETEERYAELDHELMSECLPALWQDASSIVGVFRPDSLWATLNEIKSDKTLTARKLRNFVSRFKASSEPYRREGEFIPTDLVLRKLAEPSRSFPPNTTPGPILFTANLAIFIIDLAVHDNRSKLAILAHAFPGFHAFGAFGSSRTSRPHASLEPLNQEAINLATSMKTQFFIHEAVKYHKSDSFNPNDFLQQAFFDDDAQTLGFESQDEITSNAVTKACETRMTEIRAFFSTSNLRSINLKNLKAKYPWKNFLAELVVWMEKRSLDLRTQVADQGGVDEITRKLSERTNATAIQPTPDLQIDSWADNTAETSDPTSSSRLSQRMQEFKRLRAQRDAEESESSESERAESPERDVSQSPGSPILGETTGVTEPESGRVEHKPEGPPIREPSLVPPSQSSIVPSQKTAMILQVARRQAAQSNKENIDIEDTGRRYTDKQKGAKRVDWDDQATTNRGKRQRAESEDVSDDGFETDTRGVKRPKNLQSSRSAETLNDLEYDDEVQAQVDDQLRSEDDRQHHNSSPPASPHPAPSVGTTSSRSPLQVRSPNGARPPPPEPPEPPEPPVSSAPPASRTRRAETPQTSNNNNNANYRSRRQKASSTTPQANQNAMINREAKENLRRFQAIGPSRGRGGPQVRTAWTPAEIERLMDMVAIHGTKWSKILEEDRTHADGPELQGRGQVACKDKARNIKMDYLKACRRLPDGFGAVSIKASDIALLDELNIPHQGGRGGRGVGSSRQRGAQEQEEDIDDDDNE